MDKFNLMCPTGHEYELSVYRTLSIYHRQGLVRCQISTNSGFQSRPVHLPSGMCRNWSIEQWFNHVCQRHVRSHLNGCEFDWNHRNYGCSSFIGGHLESGGYKPACIIHDMCYESGRPKSSCDYAFRDNLGELGMEYTARHIVYAAVRDHGKIRNKKTC